MEILTAADYEPGSAGKRRRSSRPCDACRKRKTRCVTDASDAAGSRCIHCRLRGTPCTFDRRQPKRRRTASPGAAASGRGDHHGRGRIQAPNPAPGEDQSQGGLGQTVRPRHSSHHPTTSPDGFGLALPADTTPGTCGSGSHADRKEDDAPARAPSVVVSPPPAEQIPHLPSDDAVPTMGLQPWRFAELYGLSSDMEPILMRHRPYDLATQEFSLETHAIRRVLERDSNGLEIVEYPLTFHMAADANALAYDPDHALMEAIEDCVRPHGPRLVELFWRHVQPCYPVLHKAIFMQQYGYAAGEGEGAGSGPREASGERGGPSSGGRRASASAMPGTRRQIGGELLGAVYLSALRWWTYDPELSIRAMPDAGRLRRLLHMALAASYHRPRLSAIQAVLLLLQCQPEDPLNPDHSYAWGLTCQALAIGQCLGLHLDSTHWSIPAWERRLRRRLSWALFMQDRWTALAYGRPVHIHFDDWGVQPLTEADFEVDGGGGLADAGTAEAAGVAEAAEMAVVNGSSLPPAKEDRRSISATGRTQFMLMVRLSQILSSVLASFYTARSSLDQDTVLLYQRALPLLAQLEAWYDSIPASLQLTISYQRKLSFHGHLHFSYYGVKIALLRRLIRSTALPPRCADDQVLSALRQLALQTVQGALSFVFGLRPDQIEAFWYFTSPYLFSLVGSFTTLLLVTSLSSHERSYWQETLNSYLWHLRTMSKSSEPMRYAVNRLEGAILRGLEHALAVNLQEPVDDTASPLMATYLTTGGVQAFATYTDFGDWDLAASLDGAFDLLGNMQYVPLQGNLPG